MNTVNAQRYQYNTQDNRNQEERSLQSWRPCSIIKTNVKPEDFTNRLIEYGKNANEENKSKLESCFCVYIHDTNACKRAIGISFYTRCNQKIDMSDYAKEIFQRAIDSIESDEVINKKACYEIIAEKIMKVLDKIIIETASSSLDENGVNEITQTFFQLAYYYVKNDKYDYIASKEKHNNLPKIIRQSSKDNLNVETKKSGRNDRNILLFIIMVMLLLINLILFKRNSNI